MKPRVLILSDPFTPPAYTPRLRFFCDYLVEAGWDIDLYTEFYEPLSFAHTYPIHEIRMYRTRGMLEWLLKGAWALLTDWRNRAFSRRVRKAIEDKQYDIVLCCTFSTFPLRAAWDIARERHIPLHVDLRDVDEQVPGAQYQHHRQWWLRPFRAWYRNVNLRRRNAVLRHATSVSSVSPWHTEFIGHITPSPVALVYNGFDARQFYWAEVKNDLFLISYIGKLYEFQDMHLIEEAVRELGKEDIRLNIRQGGIPTDQVGDLIRSSSLMLVLTNKEAKGMMTTKFYEALGCEKPVLCYPDDRGVLSAAIRATNAGIATDDKETVKAFILDRYNEWKNKGYTRQPVNPTEQSRFSRQFQAKQLENILLSSLAEGKPAEEAVTLIDICWTLFYSNTTYDFLGIKPNLLNSLIYRLFGCDLLRTRAVKRFMRLSPEEQEARAERFYTDYLEPRKIEQTWRLIEGRPVVLVSQTMDIIARTVARHIGAHAYYATQHKEEVLQRYAHFDIITDNISDMPLVLRAGHATLITYNNRSRWEKHLPSPLTSFSSPPFREGSGLGPSPITYVETGRTKY